MNLDNLRRAVILAEDLIEALEAIALDSEPMAQADDHAERTRDLLRAQLALAEADAIIKARTPPQRPAFPSWPAPGHKLPRHPHLNQ